MGHFARKLTREDNELLVPAAALAEVICNPQLAKHRRQWNNPLTHRFQPRADPLPSASSPPASLLGKDRCPVYPASWPAQSLPTEQSFLLIHLTHLSAVRARRALSVLVEPAAKMICDTSDKNLSTSRWLCAQTRKEPDLAASPPPSPEQCAHTLHFSPARAQASTAAPWRAWISFESAKAKGPKISALSTSR